MVRNELFFKTKLTLISMGLSMISMNELNMYMAVRQVQSRLAGKTWTESSSSSAKCLLRVIHHSTTLMLKQTGAPVTNPDSHFNTLSLIGLSQRRAVFP